MDWGYEGAFRAASACEAEAAFRQEVKMKIADGQPCVWEGKVQKNGHEWHLNLGTKTHHCRNCGIKVE